MKLTYLECRGRAEPIILLFIDAAAPLKLLSIPIDQWRTLHDDDKRPDRFPFGLLPTLQVPTGAAGGRDQVIAEADTILRFAEAKLSASGPEQALPKARHEMIASSTTSVTMTWFDQMDGETWRTAESLSKQLRTIVLPHLRRLEHHLFVRSSQVV